MSASPETGRFRLDQLAVVLGLIANVFLAVGKIGIGTTTQSKALLADGINSVSDILYYLAVWAYIRLARRPPDPEHPFGHRQLETIASLVVGAFVITTAGAIFWNALDSLYNRTYGVVGVPAVWMAGATIAIKVGLGLWTAGIARRTQNLATLALARDHRNDIMAAIGVLAGVGGSLYGYSALDPLAAVLVAFFIFASGLAIIRESSEELMDTVPGEQLGRQMRELAAAVPGVRDVGEIRAHRFGPHIVAMIEVDVDPEVTVAEGHDIATQVENALKARVESLIHAFVHVNPAWSPGEGWFPSGLPRHRRRWGGA